MYDYIILFWLEREKHMKITSAEDFGRVIHQQRKKRGYTQSYLADVSGFSTSFISDLENGKVTAEIGKAIILANLLGIDVEMNERL